MTVTRGRLLSVAALCFLIATYLVGIAPRAAAEEELKERGDVIITSDQHFDAEHGVVSGSGTPSDPYVISGWQVRRMHLADTGKAVVIRDNAITSQLILNWNGPNVKVVDNRIGDLRVNQNVKRTGAATSGLIAHNSIGVVGQLRHFDGVFEHNIVKPRPGLFDPVFGEREAVQFDGFNGAIFRDNTLYGSLDVKLHGHHHGSGYGDSSHHHAHGEHAMDAPDTDHTKRYHEVFVQDNTIYSNGIYALRWTDTNHRGDDRTAPSEQNEALNNPHKHWTRVHLTGNRLIGSGLYLDIFNADDRNHTGTERGFVEIAGNTITLQRPDSDLLQTRYGIEVWNVRDLELRIKGNRIVSEIEENAATETWQRTTGVFLQEVDDADVYVTNNEVSNTWYGVRASYFSESVNWWVSQLQTQGVKEAVYYDQTVSNPPNGGP